MLLADTLSRAHLPDSTPVEAEVETVNMVQHLPISSDRLHDIRSATEKDNTLQLLIKTMSQRWPKDKSQVPSEIRPYFSLQEELSHQDGIVFRGERAVIPDTLRSDITSQLHASYLGVEGCLRRARECVYWLGMNDHINKYIAKCDICISMDNKQQKETLMSHEMPSRPWANVGTVLFVFDNKDQLDYHCGLFLELLGNTLPGRYQIYHSDKEAESSFCPLRSSSYQSQSSRARSLSCTS